MAPRKPLTERDVNARASGLALKAAVMDCMVVVCSEKKRADRRQAVGEAGNYFTQVMLREP